MKIEGICPKFPSNRTATTSSGPSFHHGAPPPQPPDSSDPEDVQRGGPGGANGVEGATAQGASANVQDPTAEWSPGTYRIGAPLEKSLLLLVQHNPMENPPDSQADLLEPLSLCQSCPGLSFPRALLCLAKGYGKIARVSAVASLCCRGILP